MLWIWPKGAACQVGELGGVVGHPEVQVGRALGTSSTRAVDRLQGLREIPGVAGSLAAMSASYQVSAWAYRSAARCLANVLLPLGA